MSHWHAVKKDDIKMQLIFPFLNLCCLITRKKQEMHRESLETPFESVGGSFTSHTRAQDMHGIGVP